MPLSAQEHHRIIEKYEMNEKYKNVRFVFGFVVFDCVEMLLCSRLPLEQKYVCKTSSSSFNVIAPYVWECVYGGTASCHGLIFHLFLPSLSSWPLPVLQPN